MSFELGEALQRCGLEKGARGQMLEALATYTDEETGLATASQVTLAVRARVSERHARRMLETLIGDERLEGLVEEVSGACGRGRTAIYRVHLERVEPLAAAMKIAQRACRAGIGKALLDSGLVGDVLSPRNIRRVFGLMRSVCQQENQAAAVSAIIAQEALFEAAMAAFRAENVALQACGKPRKNPDTESAFVSGNPDILSKNPDILSTVHSIDNSPSGIYPPSREPAREAAVDNPEAPLADVPATDQALPCAEAALAVQGFAVAPERVIPWLPAGRARQRAFVEDFKQRPMRLMPSGRLLIRVRSEREEAVLTDRWLIVLLNWAEAHGIADVEFTQRQWPP